MNGYYWTTRRGNVDGGKELDYFGKAVSMSGSGERVAVGSSNSFGHVQVFMWVKTNVRTSGCLFSI